MDLSPSVKWTVFFIAGKTEPSFLDTSENPVTEKRSTSNTDYYTEFNENNISSSLIPGIYSYNEKDFTVSDMKTSEEVTHGNETTEQTPQEDFTTSSEPQYLTNKSNEETEGLQSTSSSPFNLDLTSTHESNPEIECKNTMNPDVFNQIQNTRPSLSDFTSTKTPPTTTEIATKITTPDISVWPQSSSSTSKFEKLTTLDDFFEPRTTTSTTKTSSGIAWVSNKWNIFYEIYQWVRKKSLFNQFYQNTNYKVVFSMH